MRLVPWRDDHTVAIPAEPGRLIKSQPILQFGGMTLSGTFSGEIIVKDVRKSIDLLCDEREQRSWRSLARLQWAARITQITEHECLSEAIFQTNETVRRGCPNLNFRARADHAPAPDSRGGDVLANHQVPEAGPAEIRRCCASDIATTI